MLTTSYPNNGRMIFQLCLRTNGSETSSWLVGPGPKLVVDPREDVINSEMRVTHFNTRNKLIGHKGDKILPRYSDFMLRNQSQNWNRILFNNQ